MRWGHSIHRGLLLEGHLQPPGQADSDNGPTSGIFVGLDGSSEVLGHPPTKCKAHAATLEFMRTGRPWKVGRRTVLLLSSISLVAGAQTPVPKANEEPAVPESLRIETDRQISDDKIEKRLLSIFGELDELFDVGVRVQSGVVTLSGTVPAAEDSAAAEALAERTEGVVFVRNRVERETTVQGRLAPAVDKARAMGKAAIRFAPLLMVALLAAGAMILAGQTLAKRRTWWSKLRLSPLGMGLLQRSIRMVFLIGGILIALEILDATALAGALLGIAGVVGIALGFAFRNIVENYLAGVLLSMRNPFAPGDVIEIGGHIGKVIRLTSRDAVMMTPEGNHLRIPNRTVMGSELLNFTRNPRRRFDFSVGISVDQDLVATRALGLETIRGLDGVLEDPKPWGIIEELGESTVNMRFHAWIDQRDSDFFRTRSEAIRRLKEAFDEEGIEMPEPIYRVHMTEKSAVSAPARSKLPKRAATETDTRADNTLERQIALSERGANEENLLEGDPADSET